MATATMASAATRTSICARTIAVHTKECYELNEKSMSALEGCTDDMCTMILPEECWERALNLGVADATECSINGGACILEAEAMRITNAVRWYWKVPN